MSVTVVIPNYNCAEYLERTICSVLGQTYKDTKVILWDDCSTDNSIEIANKYGIEVHKNENNAGSPSFGINGGIEKADTDYFMHVDSDDILAVNAIEMLVKNIGDADYIYGNLVPIDTNDNVLSRWKYQYYENDMMLKHIYKRGGSGIIPMFGLFKTKFLKNHNWSYLFHSEDTMSCVEYCIARWQTKYIDYDFYYYRHRSDSLSSQAVVKRAAMDEIVKRIFYVINVN